MIPSTALQPPTKSGTPSRANSIIGNAQYWCNSQKSSATPGRAVLDVCQGAEAVMLNFKQPIWVAEWVALAHQRHRFYRRDH
jgi:hypothetical protein